MCVQGRILCDSTSSQWSHLTERLKTSQVPKSFGKTDNKAEEPDSTSALREGKAAEAPCNCTIKGQRQTTPGLPFRHKTGGNQALLAARLVAWFAALPVVSRCPHYTLDLGWAVLMRQGWVSSPLLPHLHLQYRLTRLLPHFATDLLSHFPSQHLFPHLWNEDYDLCDKLWCPQMKCAVAHMCILSILKARSYIVMVFFFCLSTFIIKNGNQLTTLKKTPRDSNLKQWMRKCNAYKL